MRRQDLDVVRRQHDPSNGNNDLSYFDDPAFNRQLDAAAKLSGAKRYRAYARLELELERAPRPGCPVRDRREPRLLLRTDRVSDLPAASGASTWPRCACDTDNLSDPIRAVVHSAV